MQVIPTWAVMGELPEDVLRDCKTFQFRNFRKNTELTNPKIYHDNYPIVKGDFVRHFKAICKKLNEGKISLYSTTLGPAVTRFRITKDNFYQGYGEILTRNEIYKFIHLKVTVMKDLYEGKIALENTNWYPLAEYSYVTEPEFISEIMHDNDIYFCLD